MLITISTESAALLLSILQQTTLAVGSPDFAVMAPAIILAKSELEDALAVVVAPGPVIDAVAA